MILTSVTLLVIAASLSHGYEEVSSPEYIAKTASEKSDLIWANVMEDTTPGEWYGLLEMPHIFAEDMCETFRAPGDELPFEDGIITDGTRWKLIHSVGTVGKVGGGTLEVTHTQESSLEPPTDLSDSPWPRNPLLLLWKLLLDWVSSS